jgi:hypothetical protein
MDVIPQLDLKLSNTGWSKYSEERHENLPQPQGKKSVDNYFAFGWHQWLYQGTEFVPSWTRTFAVAKDQVLNCLTRNFYACHETLPHMENFNDSSEDLTSMWCEMRRPKNLHFPTLYRQFNNTAASPTTAIKF